MKYSFNHAGPYVEIPALDSFFHELRNICKKYRMGYRLEHTADDGFSTLQIVAVEHCDWDMFIDCLAEYETGVPFLDEAKLRWRTAIAKLEQAEEKKRNEQNARADQEEQMRKARREDDMKLNGIVLSDGVYRLVKENV